MYRWKKSLLSSKSLLLFLIVAAVLMIPSLAFAEEHEVGAIIFSLDTVWVIVAAALVLFMQAGFAVLEAGSTRMKNAGHVAGKTILSLGLASLVFWAVGFAITFGNGNGFMGTTGWFLSVPDDQVDDIFGSLSWAGVPLGAKYLFQMAFVAVSMAIAWGGFAERAKLSVYFIFGTLFAAIIYPVVGHWIWGGGWLSGLGKQDFAGSTVVHLTGGIAALMGTLLLGEPFGLRRVAAATVIVIGLVLMNGPQLI